MRKAAMLAVVGALAVAATASAQAPQGTFSGPVHCVGQDRYAPGGKIVRFDSNPTVSATLGANGLERWTYVFLGKPDHLVQTTAVRPGQHFSYKAGRHIGRAGKTTVTVVANSPETINATLDWKSTAGDYIGNGTYGLRLAPTLTGQVNYLAVKTVVKVPVDARPSRRTPVVRRSELCSGTLSP